MTTQDTSRAIIAIRGLTVVRRVGMHPWEKHPERPSRLIVDIELEMALAAYYRDADGFISYDPVRQYIAQWPDESHVDKLETLLEGLVDFIFASTPAERCRVRIEKPDIFIEVDGVGVTFDATRETWAAIRGAHNK